PLPAEEAVRLHPEDDDQIPPLSAARSHFALLRDAELRARIHPGRNGHLELSLRPYLALPLTRRARRRRDRAPPVAGGTGSGHGEAALPENDRPASLTLRTGGGRRSRRRSVSAAGAAWLPERNGHGDLPSPHRGLEGHLHRLLDVLPALRSLGARRPSRASAAEAENPSEAVTESAETAEVLEAEGLGRPSPRRGSSARPEPAEPTEAAELPYLVVLLALRLVGEHRVRLGDLLEAIGRTGIVGVRVRMVLFGELAIRLLDLVGARVLRYPENPVIVFRRRCHGASRTPTVPTTTRSPGSWRGGAEVCRGRAVRTSRARVHSSTS